MMKTICRFSFAPEGMLVIGAILLTAMPANAAAIASAAVYLSTSGSIEDEETGGGLASAQVFYGRGASPPEVIYIQGDASASANGAFGRVRSSSFLETIQYSGVGPTAINGFANEIVGAGATLTDTIQWAGNTPLVLDLDFDWTALLAGYQELHPEYGDSANEAAAKATVAFSLQIEGAGSGTITRGFYFQRAQYAFGRFDYWTLSNGQSTIDSGEDLAHFYHQLILGTDLSGGLPTELQITLTTGTGASCYIPPVQGATSICQASARASNSGYLQITGDFISANGYSYPGRSADQGGLTEVPEPSTFALSAAAVVVLLSRACRRRA